MNEINSLSVPKKLLRDMDCCWSQWKTISPLRSGFRYTGTGRKLLTPLKTTTSHQCPEWLSAPNE